MVNQYGSRTNMKIPDDGLLGGDDLGSAGNGGNLKESTAEINQLLTKVSLLCHGYLIK